MQWYHEIAMTRNPDYIIGGIETPYMNRWWLVPRNPLMNIYLHQFLRDDEDEALHDHPYANISYLLDGEYTEVTIAPGGVEHRRIAKAGSFKLRGPRFAHRIELHAGPAWSLFITGPRVREWGFHCAKSGWRPWQQFVSERDKGLHGRGCGEQ